MKQNNTNVQSKQWLQIFIMLAVWNRLGLSQFHAIVQQKGTVEVKYCPGQMLKIISSGSKRNCWGPREKELQKLHVSVIWKDCGWTTHSFNLHCASQTERSFSACWSLHIKMLLTPKLKCYAWVLQTNNKLKKVKADTNMYTIAFKISVFNFVELLTKEMISIVTTFKEK